MSAADVIFIAGCIGFVVCGLIAALMAWSALTAPTRDDMADDPQTFERSPYQFDWAAAESEMERPYDWREDGL